MIEKLLTNKTLEAFIKLYKQEVDPRLITIQKTRCEFIGDLTVVVFPVLKFSKKSPEQTAKDLGNFLIEQVDEVSSFNVIKGFLNLVIADKLWLDFYHKQHQNPDFGIVTAKSGKPVVVEYSSPNTNKPLHLGHIRNNLLGYSVSKIVEANGKNVVKVNLVNDRGIHICKSMLAWEKWGNGETPQSAGMKGDHFAGKYYVMFDQKFKAEISMLVENGMDEELAEKKASLLMEAQELLRKWEAVHPGVRAMWEKMNGWVYAGFKETYKRLGVEFDKTYYESDTYLLGREIVFEGLEKGILFKKQDGSIWCKLGDEGLDEKLLLRANRTSVYMTQDLGTAQLRKDEYDPEKLVYVVGNEQNYHFDVLKAILRKLGREWTENILHLSYGMVELPHGRMKSREGTVVDADDLMDEMYATTKNTTEELGKIDHFSAQEKDELFKMISLGALKYYILKVNPKKTILFNPEESIDFHGNTGPFIQYTYARICSLNRKAEEMGIGIIGNPSHSDLLPKEKDLIKLLYDFPGIIKEAGENYSPAVLASYCFDLAKEFNQFYQEIPVLKEDNLNTISFRLHLSEFIGSVIKTGMALLGIDVPDRM